MNLQQRLKLLPYQKRAFSEGTVEYIHNQWIFFNDQDEPTPLNELVKQPFEILSDGIWKLFEQFDEGITYGEHSFSVKNGDVFRIKKPLTIMYQEWLMELSDESIREFVLKLNKLDFSIYDCIFCHNHLYFKVNQKEKSGVNFLIFDNEEQICGIHHHFNRTLFPLDRFELTLNSGERHIVTNIHK